MRIKSITLCAVLFGVLCTVQAQDQKGYTNFQDTTFHLDEVSITGAQQKKVEISKLNVPASFILISAINLSLSVI